MTISTVAGRLVTIEMTTTGLKKAFGLDAPNSLKATYLPCFVNVPAPAVYDGWGGGMITERRTWRLLLYVTPLERPSDVAKKLVAVEPFFRLVLTAFAKAQQLDDLADIDLAWIGQDDGLDVLEYAGQLFAGIEFRCEVTERWTATVGT